MNSEEHLYLNNEENWYLLMNAEEHGPFTREELTEKLPSMEGEETWIKGPGYPNWVRAGSAGLYSDEVERKEPSSILWLFYLYFMPGTFFRNFVLKNATTFTLFSAWIYGIAGTIERIDSKIAQGKELPFGETWGSYWLAALLIGVLGGLFYLTIGGWWYKYRLKLSDAKDVDSKLVRRVYIFSSLVWVIPTILVTLTETSNLDNPYDSLSGIWYAILLIFPFWSLWTSYVGARTTFPVRRFKAVIWFLILPFAFYFITIILSTIMVFVETEDRNDRLVESFLQMKAMPEPNGPDCVCPEYAFTHKMMNKTEQLKVSQN